MSDAIKPGLTGKFPFGKISDDDKGELVFGVSYDKLNGIVEINFGIPVSWIGFTPDSAIAFAETIITKARSAK